MRSFKSDEIRNVAIAAHGGAGKTSLVEAMLFDSGLTTRIGKVDDGSTTGDYLPEELKRNMTISATLIPIEWQSKKINFLDTPGYSDFIGEVIGALQAVDSMLMVVCGVSGVEVQTKIIWEYAEHLPKTVFINKLDRENADFFSVVENLREAFGIGLTPLQIPIGKEQEFCGVVDVLTMSAMLYEQGVPKPIAIPTEIEELAAQYHNELVELCVEHDDELLLAYLEGEEIPLDVLSTALKIGISTKKITPILAGSALNNIGAQELLDYLANFAPSPTLFDFPHETAFVFKTLADPFVGKLTFLRLLSGSLTADQPLYNLNLEVEEKTNNFLLVRGKQQESLSIAHAGDLIVIPKLQETKTGHTLSTSTALENEPLPLLNLPKPNFSFAIRPKSRGDEDKLSQGLQRLQEEDGTLVVEKNRETKETILIGMGELHVEIIAERLKTKFGVEIDLSTPKIPYRETITKAVKIQGKHKKQSGGAGQYGDVWLNMEPLPDEHFAFEETVFGGAVPRNYFPAIEKGIREAMVEGSLGKYPITNVKVTLYDGSYHPVDSNEMSFKLAASLAFKKGLEKAEPVLLEPVMTVSIIIPDSFMGDIISDLTSKRGKILGMEPLENKQIVHAQVPLSEMQKYTIDLKSLTQGQGIFTSELSHYEKVPAKLAAQLVE